MSLRQEMLMNVHETHLGMDKRKSRARSVMYWPSVCQEINDMIATCSDCAKFLKPSQREPLIPHEIPALPVGADIFYICGKTYLVIVITSPSFRKSACSRRGRQLGL